MPSSDDRTGNPLKAVFAARIRIAAVNACSRKNGSRLAEGGEADLAERRALRRRRGKPISAAGSSAMCTSAANASAVIPANIVVAKTP